MPGRQLAVAANRRFAKPRGSTVANARQIAAARSGVLTPLTTAEVAARDRASQEYDAGLNLFFARRYAEAEALLDRATRNDAADQGLSEVEALELRE